MSDSAKVQLQLRLPVGLHERLVASKVGSLNAEIVRRLEGSFGVRNAVTVPVPAEGEAAAARIGEAYRSLQVDPIVRDPAKPKRARSQMCEHRRRPDEYCAKCDG